jgi:hypothetical protein
MQMARICRKCRREISVCCAKYQKNGVSTIVLIDGDGYKKQAFDWFKKRVFPNSALRGVYTMKEFQKLANGGFLG